MNLCKDGCACGPRPHMSWHPVQPKKILWEPFVSMYKGPMAKSRSTSPLEPEAQRTNTAIEACLDNPVILLGRGGSGTRVLSQIARDAGVFLGNDINISGDSVEWVQPIYDLAIESCAQISAVSGWTRHLQDHARGILGGGVWMSPQLWGWKLPETMLILPEALEAFSSARVVHLVRHPITTCLRRTHMTSRYSNPVGRAVLGAAYRNAGRPETAIEEDEHWKHNAISWVFQLSLLAEVRRQMDPARYLELRFEDLVDEPEAGVARLRSFLGREPSFQGSASAPAVEIDPARAAGEAASATPDTDPRAAWIWSLCGPVAESFGYERVPPAEKQS